MVVMNNVAWIVYNIPPIYHNYQIGAFTNNRIENSTLEFSVHYTIPKLDREKVWIPVTLINLYLICAVASLHCILDLYLSLAVFQIVGHLYILKHSLTSIPRPKNKTFVEVYDMPIAVEMFDDEENKQVYKDISECRRSYDSPEQSTSKVAAEANGSVRQGICERIAVRAGCPFVGCDRTSDNFKTQLAIRFTNEVSVLFGPTIAISYLFHLFGCCLSLLQVLSGTSENQITRDGAESMYLLYRKTIQGSAHDNNNTAVPLARRSLRRSVGEIQVSPQTDYSSGLSWACTLFGERDQGLKVITG
ncbi:hypothetical protein EVAR_34668_1 [Eumeta japonica]|uniref:Uncharacterized protein n=1 Tax=Eumeta variegata TaxID=151549 RepID=A0A4C1VGP5_EUMVA|nr:hypothetical protein EVAR_34668_1 [Eumeta japonica]